MSNVKSAGGFSILGNYSKFIFWPAAILYCIIIGFAISSPEGTGSFFVTVRDIVLKQMNWLIMLSLAVAVIACVYFSFGKYANVKLGNEDVEPEFSFYAWVAMLFCTGLGTGFVIFGSAEPIYHLFSSPYVDAAGVQGQFQAVPEAIRLAVVNWGLLGFPLFAIGGWAIGYAAYRYKKPFRTSTGLYGIFGEKCNDTIIGKIVDVLACIATIGGVSMMIGLGVSSISYAVQLLFEYELSNTAKIILMLAIIVAYIISASTGLSKGIKILSESTGYLAFFLLFAVLLLSATPMAYILSVIVEVTGEFLWRIPQSLFWLDVGGVSASLKDGVIEYNPSKWTGGWSVFFVLWNTSYIAFTGGVVARISRGRTLRQFILGVSITPIILCIIWFSVWGANSSFMQITGLLPDLSTTIADSAEKALYTVLGTFPLGSVLCFIAFITFILFAVTTANAASFFLAQQTTEGHDRPTIINCVFWGSVIGLTGILFQIQGGFDAIKALAIVAASPFVFVTFAYVYSILKMFKMDFPKDGLLIKK